MDAQSQWTGLDAGRLERITDHLERNYIAPGKIAGCQVAVARHGHVAYAQSFIHRHLQPSVQPLNNDGFEVDALATVGKTHHSVLGVNKTPRQQHVSLVTDAVLCQRHPVLELFGADNQTRSAPLVCSDAQVQFDLPGETLFAVTWNAP